MKKISYIYTELSEELRKRIKENTFSYAKFDGVVLNFVGQGLYQILKNTKYNNIDTITQSVIDDVKRRL